MNLVMIVLFFLDSMTIPNLGLLTIGFSALVQSPKLCEFVFFKLR